MRKEKINTMEYKGFRIYNEKETEELKRRYFESQVNGIVDDEALIWSQDDIRLGFIRMIMGLPVKKVNYYLAVDFETYHKELYDEELRTLIFSKRLSYRYEKENNNEEEWDYPDDNEWIEELHPKAQKFADIHLDEQKKKTPEWMLQNEYVLVTYCIYKQRDNESFMQFLNSILTSGNNIEKSLNNLDDNGKPLRIFQGICDSGYDHELTKVVNK